jgi:hypothetical protein
MRKYEKAGCIVGVEILIALGNRGGFKSTFEKALQMVEVTGQEFCISIS